MQNPEQSEQPNAPADFPAYPAYKPSDVEWMGDVPAHWDVRWLKFWVDTNKRTLSEKTDPNFQFRYIEIGGVSEGALLNEPAAIRFGSAPSRARRIVRQGDTIVSTVRTYLKAVWFADDEADDLVCSTGFAVLTPKVDAFPKFVSYVVQSDAFTHQVMANSVGVAYPAISVSKLRVLSVPVPPLLEQRAIAAYLDRKGAIARRYAHVARHIIDTLRELRQVEIHDAVTRGLNEDIPLKPSGVEWLGDVPAHWDTRRLRYVAEMRTSNVDKHVKLNENPVRLCNYVDVYHNERISSDLDFMRATATDREIERFRLERGDVIITKDSETWNDIGVPALVEYTADDLVCGYHLALLRPFESVMTGAYLLRALQAPTVASQFHIQANGVTRYGLTQNAIKSVHIPVPPLAEQRAIAEYLDTKTAAIDAAIAHYERMAELVAEYWTVLVADAVTGRIDLRQEAAQPE